MKSLFLLSLLFLIPAGYTYAGSSLEESTQKCIAFKDKIVVDVDTLINQIDRCILHNIKTPQSYTKKSMKKIEKGLIKLYKMIKKALAKSGPPEEWNWLQEEVDRVPDKSTDHWHGAFYALRDAQNAKGEEELIDALNKAKRYAGDINYKLGQLNNSFRRLIEDKKRAQDEN